MGRVKQFFVRTHYIGISSVLAVGVLIGSISLSGQASAAALSEQSIQLSSSTKAATDVTYTVNFTAAGAAGAVVVDFCSDSPVIGDGCTAPVGFDASAADSATTAVTSVTGATNRVVVELPVTETQMSFDIDNITNPTEAGPLYARIVSFDNTTNANAYVVTAEPGAGSVDTGSVGLAITDAINVSGKVLESMYFCVSAAEIGVNCAGAGANPPVLVLGEDDGGTKALQVGAVSTGNIFTQLTTNAAGGAIVSLKSDAAGCGGLMRAGAPAACDIAPALAGGITAGEAKFGLMLADAVDTTGYTGTGVLQPVAASGYSNSAFALNYEETETTGVTSVYGDKLLDTAGAPVDNKNVMITFGASVSNQTPGGDYAANISLIATGKF